MGKNALTDPEEAQFLLKLLNLPLCSLNCLPTEQRFSLSHMRESQLECFSWLKRSQLRRQVSPGTQTVDRWRSRITITKTCFHKEIEWRTDPTVTQIRPH